MEDVIACCTEALRCNPEDWDSWKRAMAFQQLRQFDHTIDDCTQIINSSDSHNKSEALLVRGKIYFDMGQERRGVWDWEESVRLEPQVSVTWRNLGTAYSHQRRFRKEVRALETAVELDPTDIHALTNLGNVFLQLGNDKEALFNHTKALKIAELVQDNTGLGPTLYANRGLDYAMLGQEYRAIQDCDQASG